jgi:hypothetical protein
MGPSSSSINIWWGIFAPLSPSIVDNIPCKRGKTAPFILFSHYISRNLWSWFRLQSSFMVWQIWISMKSGACGDNRRTGNIFYALYSNGDHFCLKPREIWEIPQKVQYWVSYCNLKWLVLFVSYMLALTVCIQFQWCSRSYDSWEVESVSTEGWQRPK